MSFQINETCTGCSACVRLCPTEAIAGEKKQRHAIDTVLCIECGACGRICPEGSVLDRLGHPRQMVKRSGQEEVLFLRHLHRCLSGELPGPFRGRRERRPSVPLSAGRKGLHRLHLLCGRLSQRCHQNGLMKIPKPCRIVLKLRQYRFDRPVDSF
jgi:ferredoxin